MTFPGQRRSRSVPSSASSPHVGQMRTPHGRPARLSFMVRKGCAHRSTAMSWSGHRTLPGPCFPATTRRRQTMRRGVGLTRAQHLLQIQDISRTYACHRLADLDAVPAASSQPRTIRRRARHITIALVSAPGRSVPPGVHRSSGSGHGGRGCQGVAGDRDDGGASAARRRDRRHRGHAAGTRRRSLQRSSPRPPSARRRAGTGLQPHHARCRRRQRRRQDRPATPVPHRAPAQAGCRTAAVRPRATSTDPSSGW